MKAVGAKTLHLHGWHASDGYCVNLFLAVSRAMGLGFGSPTW